jgi:hypothetical protein
MLQLRINTGAVTVPIISETGETIGSFRFNPTDSNILSRLDAVASYFQSVDYDKGAETTVEEITELDGIIKEKFDYLLGYPVSGELFKACGPLSPTGNGSLFFLEVLEGIAELCNEALADRAKTMDNIREATQGYLEEAPDETE